jgi:hypothetical protein
MHLKRVFRLCWRIHSWFYLSIWLPILLMRTRTGPLNSRIAYFTHNNQCHSILAYYNLIKDEGLNALYMGVRRNMALSIVPFSVLMSGGIPETIVYCYILLTTSASSVESFRQRTPQASAITNQAHSNNNTSTTLTESSPTASFDRSDSQRTTPMENPYDNAPSIPKTIRSNADPPPITDTPAKSTSVVVSTLKVLWSYIHHQSIHPFMSSVPSLLLPWEMSVDADRL